MYSGEIKKENITEVQISPLSKWKRVLVYLGDLMISFIIAVFFMNVAVMPIYSLFNNTNSKRANEAETLRNDILYEHKLLFYRDDLAGRYSKNNFDGNLAYTFDRYLAYYVFDTNTSINSSFPEYCHLEENEIIKTYYIDIRNDNLTYFDLYSKQSKIEKYFDITSSSVALKQTIKDNLKVYFMPGESLGSTGLEYYEDISDIFSALYGCVIQDIYKNDLTDSKGNSFNDYQAIISEISDNYYKSIAICGLISYVLAWSVVKVIYPLINKERRTMTMSIMKVDRLGYNNLFHLSKAETFFTSIYSLLMDLPYITFLSLSYTTLIYSLSVPVLPLLSIVSLLIVLISLFFIVFNPFNRSIIDLLSQSIIVPTEYVDAIIKAKETLEEIKKSKKGKING